MATSTRRSIAHRYPTIAPNFVDLTTDNDVITTPMAEKSNGNKSIDGDLYKQLQELDEMDGVIRNKNFIYCLMCEHFIDVYDGILIRECLHQVCIDCIRKSIIACVNVDVKCPAVDCVYFLQDREIRSLLTQTEYEFHSNKYEMANCNEQSASDNGQMHNNDEKLYKELLNLEQQGIIHNPEPFECEICITDIVSYEGIIIRECLHQFCIDCVRHTIVHSEEVEIKCPANACDCFIQDREIRSLLTQAEFDHYSMKVLRIAESKATNSYHCKMANCEGWCIVEEEVNTFICPRCFSKNCLACRVKCFCVYFFEIVFFHTFLNDIGNPCES